jgi:hypothetical protein
MSVISVVARDEEERQQYNWIFDTCLDLSQRSFNWMCARQYMENPYVARTRIDGSHVFWKIEDRIQKLAGFTVYTLFGRHKDKHEATIATFIENLQIDKT